MPSTDNVSTDTKKVNRGRPRRLDRDEGVAICEALFHAQGYDVVGIAAICDAVGVRQPALYAAYGSKARLFELVLDRYAKGPFGCFVAEQMAQADAPETALRSVLLAAADQYSSHDERRGCLALEASVNASDLSARDSATALVERTHDLITRRYALLGASDPNAWADATMLSLRGLSAQARAGAQNAALRQAVEVIAGQGAP